jgi:NADH-quinone oxidoreductase subunit G
MACCGGCVSGGGQPISSDRTAAKKRAKGLYNSDKMLQFHISSENPYLQQIYAEDFGDHKAHSLLHTEYKNRRRITHEDIVLVESSGKKAVSLEICFGTSCFLRGAQTLYREIMEYIRENRLEESIEFKATFCGKHCKKGPVLNVNGKTLEHCTAENAKTEIQRALQR